MPEVAEQLALLEQALVVPYTLTRSARRRRTIEISIDAGGGVCVAAPMRTPRYEIDEFVARKARWIAKAIEATRATHHRARRALVTGAPLPYLGRSLTLRVREDGARGVALIGSELVVRVRAGLSEPELRRRIEDWYRAQAEVVLSERVRRFAPLAGVRPARVLVKTQKTRWGSCGKDGALRFNWALIMAPLTVIDYLVVHELCHLRQAGHGRRFWRYVAAVLPDYAARRAELRRDGWKYRL